MTRKKLSLFLCLTDPLVSVNKKHSDMGALSSSGNTFHLLAALDKGFSVEQNCICCIGVGELNSKKHIINHRSIK